jgi:hypothetical protein
MRLCFFISEEDSAYYFAFSCSSITKRLNELKASMALRERQSSRVITQKKALCSSGVAQACLQRKIRSSQDHMPNSEVFAAIAGLISTISGIFASQKT